MAKIIDEIAANLQRNFNPPKPKPFAKHIPRNDTDLGTGNQANLNCNQPVQIVGWRANRRSVKIVNLSPYEIYLSGNSSPSAQGGDLLPAGHGAFVVYDESGPVFGIVYSPFNTTAVAAVTWAETFA